MVTDVTPRANRNSTTRAREGPCRMRGRTRETACGAIWLARPGAPCLGLARAPGTWPGA